MNEYPERLQYALDTRKMSQSELARKIGVKPQSIQYLCRKRKGKRSAYSSNIAEALSINTKWLTDGEGPMNSDDSLSPYYCNWDQLSDFLTCKNKEKNYKQMIVEKTKFSKDSLIVKINHNRLQPYVLQYEFCLIDPEPKTLNKKVLVKINNTFLIMEHIKLEHDFLIPINNQSPHQKMTEELNYQIIGIIKGIWKPMRKG